MAKIKQGILGALSGKIGGVTGASWKGRAVIRGNNNCDGEKHSVLQTNQHVRMRKSANVYKCLRDSVLDGYYLNLNKKVTMINNMYAVLRRGFGGTTVLNFFNVDIVTGLFPYYITPVFSSYDVFTFTTIFLQPNIDFSDLSNDVELYCFTYNYTLQKCVSFQKVLEWNAFNRIFLHYDGDLSLGNNYQFVFFLYDRQHNVFSMQKNVSVVI